MTKVYKMPRYLSLTLIGVVLLSGCSTLKSTDDPSAQISSDPLEGLNRGIYAFNDTADKLILKPVAKGYQAIVPEPAQRGVSNFFSNLGEPFSAANNLLQGKFDRTLSSIYRFTVNSTVGLFGLLDVAGHHEVEPAPEDFGQTLGAWGVGPGPYIMLPFMGPTNVRDGIGRVTSGFVYYPPSDLSDQSSTDVGLSVLQVVDTRASLLSVDSVLEQQVDPYSFIKSAYEQNRLNSLYDGSPPVAEEDFDF